MCSLNFRWLSLFLFVSISLPGCNNDEAGTGIGFISSSRDVITKPPQYATPDARDSANEAGISNDSSVNTMARGNAVGTALTGDTATEDSIVQLRAGLGWTRLGWTELKNTRLRDVCPPEQEDGNAGPYKFNYYCTAVLSAWSSAIADTSRSRMIIWGGGHADYYGNELYALDLNKGTVSRLNEPTTPTNRNDHLNCNEEIPPGVGGFPNSRHTYGTLAHIAHADVMYVFGGGLACSPGKAGKDTWILDLSSLKWHRMDPVDGPQPITVVLAAIADYDPKSELVYLLDRYNLYSYELETNTYTLLRSGLDHGLNIHGAIEPNRQWFITVGPDPAGNPSLGIIDLAEGSDYSRREYPEVAAKCPSMSVRNPGIAYEPNLDVMVVWGGGSQVDLFDPKELTCTTIEATGDPGPAAVKGTYGRLRYFPSQGVIAVINHVDRNAYTLRLSE